MEKQGPKYEIVVGRIEDLVGSSLIGLFSDDSVENNSYLLENCKKHSYDTKDKIDK